MTLKISPSGVVLSGCASTRQCQSAYQIWLAYSFTRSEYMMGPQNFKNGSHEPDHAIWGSFSLQGKEFIQPTRTQNLTTLASRRCLRFPVIIIIGWPLHVTVRPMLSDRCLSVCLSVLSVCNVGILWPNGWMDQDATWYGGGLGPGDIVLDGDPAPLRKGAQQPPPLFGPCLLWSNGCPAQQLLSSFLLSGVYVPGAKDKKLKANIVLARGPHLCRWRRKTHSSERS